MEEVGAWVADGLLVLLVALSGYTDLRYQKIRNIHTFPAMAVGLAMGAVAGGWVGLGLAFAGLGLGLLLVGILFAMGVMKAGDVKLAMAMGALCGPGEIARGLVLSFILYLPVGVVTIVAKSGLRNVWKALKRLGWFFYTTVHPLLKAQPLDSEGMTLAPFGVVMGAAVLLVHFGNWMNSTSFWGR